MRNITEVTGLGDIPYPTALMHFLSILISHPSTDLVVLIYTRQTTGTKQSWNFLCLCHFLQHLCSADPWIQPMAVEATDEHIDVGYSLTLLVNLMMLILYSIRIIYAFRQHHLILRR